MVTYVYNEKVERKRERGETKRKRRWRRVGAREGKRGGMEAELAMRRERRRMKILRKLYLGNCSLPRTSVPGIDCCSDILINVCNSVCAGATSMERLIHKC